MSTRARRLGGALSMLALLALIAAALASAASPPAPVGPAKPGKITKVGQSSSERADRGRQVHAIGYRLTHSSHRPQDVAGHRASWDGVLVHTIGIVRNGADAVDPRLLRERAEARRAGPGAAPPERAPAPDQVREHRQCRRLLSRRTATTGSWAGS